jgi:hypothetical protein
MLPSLIVTYYKFDMWSTGNCEEPKSWELEDWKLKAEEWSGIKRCASLYVTPLFFFNCQSQSSQDFGSSQFPIDHMSSFLWHSSIVLFLFLISVLFESKKVTRKYFRKSHNAKHFLGGFSILIHVINLS